MVQISIVIPVYNGEKTIQETINSVLAQTFTNIEVIVINDGSSDRTAEIVQEITDPRVSLYNYPNGGPASSRNRGIEKSHGEYISFIDADDLWTKDKLASQYQALQSYPQAAVAYSGTDCIDENSNFIRHASPPIISGNVYKNLLLANLLGSGSNPLIRIEALAVIGNFDESFSGSEDWDLYIRLAAKYEFVGIDAQHILYRQSSNSLSSNLGTQEQDNIRLIQKAFRQAPFHFKYLKRSSFANTYRYLIYKCLHGASSHKQGLKGLELIIKLLINDPSAIKYKITWKILARIILITCLSPKQIKKLLHKFPKLEIAEYEYFTRMKLDP